MLKEALDQVPSQGPDSAWDVVLVLLDPCEGVLQSLRLKGKLSHQQSEEEPLG